VTLAWSEMDHISASRLFDMVHRADTSFTDEEWDHFAHCESCVKHFQKFVRELPSMKESNRNARSTKPGD
jgi:hypothetical protein